MKLKQMLRAVGILLSLAFLVWCMNTPPLQEVAGDSVAESPEPTVSESKVEEPAEQYDEEVAEGMPESEPESEPESLEPEVV